MESNKGTDGYYGDMDGEDEDLDLSFLDEETDKDGGVDEP